ncbi:MAG TPA: hypothetical protein VG476_02690 [Acidimicrobiales bacterium]|nr:hypothetical protein [Acidimicrobiales bacterium]
MRARIGQVVYYAWGMPVMIVIGFLAGLALFLIPGEGFWYWLFPNRVPRRG